MGAKPGDIFNGHILGEDNLWHRLAAEGPPQATVPPAPEPMASLRVEPLRVQRDGPSHGAPAALSPPSKPIRKAAPGYWIRYRRGWLYTSSLVGVACGLAVMLYQASLDEANAVPQAMLFNFLIATVTNGLWVGSLVNLLVAIYRGAPKVSPQHPGQPGAVPPASPAAPVMARPLKAQVCPECRKTVQPSAAVMHPRYCAGRASQHSQSGVESATNLSAPPVPVKAEPSEMELLRQLADRLTPLVLEWDARVTAFEGQQAVVLDLYPNQTDGAGVSHTVGMVAVYTIQDGEWWAQTLMLDTAGDPMQPAPPAQSIGIGTADVAGAVKRLLTVVLTSYRKAANFQPTGGPQDALFLGWAPHARSALERLTDIRISRIALSPAKSEPAAGPTSR